LVGDRIKPETDDKTRWMTPVGVFFICQNEDKCHFVNSTISSQGHKPQASTRQECWPVCFPNGQQGEL
ncbi:hypothetical protein, partial [Dysosmobacter sp.]|uniref:hypothetical protein n=1 Tax=Dysosmobacter sp. TaxID=2591382 RepID=UPI003AABDDF9